MLRWLRAIPLICVLSGAAVGAAAAQGSPPRDLPAPSDPPPPPEPERAPPPAPEPQPSPAPRPESEPAPAEPEPEPQLAAPPREPEPEPEPYRGEPFEGQVGAGDGESDPEYPDDWEQDEDADRAGDGGRGGFEMPGFSIRLDPFNWLIEGRLGLELEVAAWEFISVELVPVFVANSEPPSFNFAGRDDPVSQHSNGIGAIAGTSIGAGFWLSGTPFQGYVLRAIFTNYGFTYKSTVGRSVIDRVEFTERRLVAFFGSHSRWGFFTLSGGIGLGYELNQQQRCFDRGSRLPNGDLAPLTTDCPDDGEQHILLERDGSAVADLNGGLHPIYLEGRFSIGVAFD